MSDHNEAAREQFEKWAKQEGYKTDLHALGDYQFQSTAFAWHSWQGCWDTLAQAPHVPVSLDDLPEWERPTKKEMWDTIQSIRKLTEDDGTFGDPSNLVKAMVEELTRLGYKGPYWDDAPDKIAGQSGNAGVVVHGYLQCSTRKPGDTTAMVGQEDIINCPTCIAAHQKATPDTSKIDTPAEVGESAKNRFDELTTGDNPYHYEWRSFYNGYLEGAFRRREESAPGKVREGGLAEYGTTKEADNLPVGGELSGLPVEDQVRLYRASGGSVEGEKRFRAFLEASEIVSHSSKIDAAVEAFSPLDSIVCPEPTTGSQSDTFPKGCPLTPSQVRNMQKALAAIRSTK